jgi:hypothetical protein
MSQRVSCRRCSAHRDPALSAKCLVCGATAADPVPPSVGDLTALYAQLLDTAVALYRVQPSPEVAAVCEAVTAAISAAAGSPLPIPA